MSKEEEKMLEAFKMLREKYPKNTEFAIVARDTYDEMNRNQEDLLSQLLQDLDRLYSSTEEGTDGFEECRIKVQNLIKERLSE